jgi:hypothetical protein
MGTKNIIWRAELDSTSQDWFLKKLWFYCDACLKKTPFVDGIVTGAEDDFPKLLCKACSDKDWRM